jgi:hypothetical protein
MKREIVPVAQIAQAIHFLCGQKVMLDFDLAALCGVTVENSNRVPANTPACEIEFHVQESSPLGGRRTCQ